MKGSALRINISDTHSPSLQVKMRHHSQQAASVVYPPPFAFRCHPWMKEIEQAAAVLSGSLQTVDRRVSPGRQDYFTVLDIYA